MQGIGIRKDSTIVEKKCKDGNAELPATDRTVNRSLRPLPAGPDPSSVDVEQIRDGNQRDSYEPQGAGCPVNAHLAEHDAREEREAAGEQAAEESICRDGAGSVLLEGIDEVVQGGLEDGEEAEAHGDGAGVGADPVDVLCAGPAEDEQAGGEEDGSDHHGREAGLRNGEIVVGFEALDVESLVEEVEGCAEEDADEVGEEGEGADDWAPAADFLKFDGKGGETQVKDSVDEGCVERDEKADRGG